LLFTDDIIEGSLFDVGCDAGREQDVKGGIFKIANGYSCKVLEEQVVFTDQVGFICWSQSIACPGWDKDANLFL